MNKYVLLLIPALACVLLGSCRSPYQPTAEDVIRSGENNLQARNYEQAVSYFLRVIDIESGNPRGYTGAAEAFVMLGYHYRAIETLRLGAGRIPGNQAIRDMLAELLEQEDSGFVTATDPNGSSDQPEPDEVYEALSDAGLRGEWQDTITGLYIYFDGFRLLHLDGLDARYQLDDNNIILLYGYSGQLLDNARFEYQPADDTLVLVLWSESLGGYYHARYYQKVS